MGCLQKTIVALNKKINNIIIIIEVLNILRVPINLTSGVLLDISFNKTKKKKIKKKNKKGFNRICLIWIIHVFIIAIY